MQTLSDNNLSSPFFAHLVVSMQNNSYIHYCTLQNTSHINIQYPLLLTPTCLQSMFCFALTLSYCSLNIPVCNKEAVNIQGWMKVKWGRVGHLGLQQAKHLSSC